MRYRCLAGLKLVGNEFAICKNHTFGVPPVCRYCFDVNASKVWHDGLSFSLVIER